MSALDKINDLIVRIQSGDEEFVAVFENDFKKFEEEYDKETMMIQVEEMVGRMFATSKEMSNMMTLRQTADRVRREKGYPIFPIDKGINDINISYVVDKLVKSATLEAKRGGYEIAVYIKDVSQPLSSRHKLKLCDEIERGLSEYFVDIFNIDIEYHDGEMYATLEW